MIMINFSLFTEASQSILRFKLEKKSLKEKNTFDSLKYNKFNADQKDTIMLSQKQQVRRNNLTVFPKVKISHIEVTK